ncbi:YcnI family protein [Rathayibacter sp. VKM Ac-2928]|uniref:YcnI family copper-binding membrane protein n=1 Tax=Rathayibacter sp. VKM Ac-2928 TaxID=2929479 RepID=UPI001FB51431|nr:YcnI family protein [Rathayibacter sp. VKM Ac-2928]MCJ1681767.1 YcnI family protein [Rathayibacter sp. VKM Ac-2928]
MSAGEPARTAIPRCALTLLGAALSRLRRLPLGLLTIMTTTRTSSSASAFSSRVRLVGGGALVAAGSVALALAAPTAASAHVTAAASSTAAGSYTVVTFSLAHGCEGSPTTGLSITIPEGINSVSPTVNPNWDVVKNEVEIADPVTDSHGNTATQRVSNVVYTAKTALADGYRDTVSLQLQLPEDAAGSTLEFPVLQTCETGSTAWDQPTVEGEDEPELPAPTVAVTAAMEGSGHHDDDGDGDDAVATTASATTAAGQSDDVLARVLGVGGLVLGAVGVAFGLASRRRSPKASA